ncbi:hypothetical protein [Streptosporangium longisporum]|uniref:Chaplin domain-containing protein n=1 Tax=Streptosporangium longisporum TaxID=46187 RepID=A0ABP6L4X6_9ACTN
MPKFNSVIAGLAISTALTGGVVGMGAATTVTSAAASVTTVTAAAFPTHGCGWGHRRHCCGDRYRHHHKRFKLIINNNNDNNNDLENRTDRVVPLVAADPVVPVR